MQKLVVAGGAVSAVGLVLVGMFWSGILPSPFDNSHGAIPACVERTKEQLRSPASFKLIWSDYSALPPLTSEERKQAFQAQGSSDPFKGDQITQAYIRAIEIRGPKLAERLTRGDKLSGIDAQIAQAWIEGQEAERANAARIAKNLPEDQSAHVTLEYDADNGFGASIRSFGMCKFGAIGGDGVFAKSDIILSGPIDADVGRQTKELSERKH